MTDVLEAIKLHHRRRRFAMKIQQKLDRSLESFVRLNATDWSPDGDKKARDKANARAKQIIEMARKGTESHDDAVLEVASIVMVTDEARRPADELRKHHEKAMTLLAADLPVWRWAETVDGIGALGLATIIAETGDLSKYANPAKVWKRLGYAPFEGAAGSTYKRDKWRPRALTSQEWTASPFNGERYSMLYVISTWLVNRQVEGAEKSGTDFGRPKGPYGEVYVKRRERTAGTHPDWTPAHARNDALRVTMKKFLLDLWVEWRAASQDLRPIVLPRLEKSQPASASLIPQDQLPAEAAGQLRDGTLKAGARRQKIPMKKRAAGGLKPIIHLPADATGGP